ncbi:MAG: PEP/pyruvate-binding domain-containing protein [Planctomycetota bacterium]
MGDARGGSHDAAETRRHLEGYLQAYPGLRGRVCRILLLHLHRQGLARIDDVYRRAERAEEEWTTLEPNRPAPRLWAADEKELINGIVIDLAAQHLTPDQVDDIVWAAHRRDEAQSLETLARMSEVPLELITEKVAQYASLADKSTDGRAPEGTLVALIRRLVSNRVDYISVAKRCLRVRDISWVLDRVVSSDAADGYIGGKAAGMLLAAAILRSAEVGEVHLPPSIFVLSDAYDEFKRENGLLDLDDHKYQSIEQVRSQFRAVREVFHNGEFPGRVSDYLRIALDKLGEVPLIVRSSSLLEDSFGAAFSGIYHSLFLPNRGPLEERLLAVQSAIAEIYAGVFSPDAISYRKRHNLLDHDERMAVMIQTVVGEQRGAYHFPEIAGVAFSRNDYRWSRRIRREDGLLRLVLGLGTHAVDRVGDYARMIPLNAPTMRPEATPEEVMEASQKQVDVVDLEGEGFTRIGVSEALRALGNRGIGDYVSIVGEDGGLAMPVGDLVREEPEKLCVTFDRMLDRGGFPRRIRSMLGSLERSYRRPVDLEFAVHRERFYVLQCRPLGGDVAVQTVTVPAGVKADDRIFSADRYVNPGKLDAIEYVVLVDPRDYDRIGTVDDRNQVARAVGRINDALADRRFILMGPGRWGSRDVNLGVQVGFADISHAKALLEIARAEGDYTPEPSFGTHFFQELVEASILYLPLYPDDEGVTFNEAFLHGSENALAWISPEDARMADVIRVLDIGQITAGRRLHLAMDGEAQEALAYLADR